MAYGCQLILYGHTSMATPDLVRSRKLSRVGPGQYLDGRPPGNTRCCMLFFSLTQKLKSCNVHKQSFMKGAGSCFHFAERERERPPWIVKYQIWNMNKQPMVVKVFRPANQHGMDRSRQILEAKQGWAWLVVGWETDRPPVNTRWCMVCSFAHSLRNRNLAICTSSPS